MGMMGIWCIIRIRMGSCFIRNVCCVRSMRRIIMLR